MNIASLLDQSTVKIPLEGLTVGGVIAELLELLVQAGKVSNRDGVLDALYQREAKGSTGLGGGVALPHAQHPDINGVVLAVGVSHAGIEFDAADGEPVYLVFLLMGTPEEPGPNVGALADIGHLKDMPGLYEKLLAAPGSAELINIIKQAQQDEGETP